MDVKTILGPGGTLEKAIPGFGSRPGQVEMSEAMGAKILAGGLAVYEGGTGLGKTYAYLVPLILSKRKALISTGTKNLQNQLFTKDFPVLCNAMGMHPEARLLKGRANYLCRLRFERMRAAPDLLEGGAEWKPIEMFVASTQSGDLDELDAASESPELRRQLGSTRESCTGRDCEHYSDCFFYKARREANDAQIAVVNHFLYLSDLNLREDDRKEILPDSDVFVFDEAHGLPEAAVSCFGRTVTTTDIVDRLGDLAKQLRIVRPDEDILPMLEKAPAAHAKLLEETRRFADGNRTDGDEHSREEILSDKKLSGSIEGLCETVELSAQYIADLENIPLDVKGLSASLLERVGHLRAWLNPGKADEEGEATTYASWARYDKSRIWFTNAPVDVDRILEKRFRESGSAHIFTSATLSVGDSLDNFAAMIGVKGVESRIWPSPFPYERCSLLLVPDGLPPPVREDRAEHEKCVQNLILELGEANGGRAFALFTSLRAMRSAAYGLRDRLRKKGIRVLLQGSESNPRLLERFRSQERCILFGSHSFSMGVDIKGERLSLVVFDKIPFQRPNDPLMRERERLLKDAGQDPFSRLQIPHAALCLKQAAGRLIRDESDSGVFVLCDPRIVRSRYGKTLLESMPPMKFTSSVDEAKEMLRRIQ